MSLLPFSSRQKRIAARAKTPLPATQTAAFLLLLSVGAAAACLPSQTRIRLVSPLVHLSQETLQLAYSTGLQLPATDKVFSHFTVNGLSNTPSVLLTNASVKAIRPRAVPTLTVNSTGDGNDATPGDGVCQTSSQNGASCTLRAAITESDASGGGTINFNIPGAGVHTISPATQLPQILVPVTINGYSQPGATANTLAVGDNAKILIEVNNANATGAGAGLFINAGSSGSTVSGLAINNVPNGGGIVIQGSAVIANGSNTNTVQGCFIGTDASGTVARPNAFNGVVIFGSSGNLIGGATPAARNVISGNGTQQGTPGVLLEQSVTGNTVQNNYIGTDLTGTKALANGGSGIQVFTQSSDASNSTGNILVGNLVSGNGTVGGFAGIEIDSPKASTTTIQGNKVGTDVTGTAAIPNAGSGIQLSGSSNNTIGGINAGQGNLISGNKGVGIDLANGSNSNTVQGNLIGTNAAGTTALGNVSNGIAITSSGNNTVGGTASGARNVVSGNGIPGQLPGILVNMSPTGVAANTVVGNYVGTNAAGTAALGNGGSGIQVFSATADTLNTNGTAVTGNLLSGNGFYGLDIDGPKTQSTTALGNKIGTDVTGTKAIPNGLAGVQLLGCSNNTVGGLTAGQSNLISGNKSAGLVFSANANSNTARGNLIGTDITGLKALSNGLIGVGVNNASNNTISSNTITSATTSGVFIGGASATGTIIQSNNIGVGSDGTTPLGNAGDGILFQGAAPGHTVGNPLSVAAGLTKPRATVAGGLGNIIANNGGAGVSIKLATAQACHRKSVLGNSIYNNGGLGIDLNGDGVTTNQPSSNQGDSTSGPNALQNYPILSPNVTRSGGNATITGSLTSAPNATFRIEFFSSPTADSSGFGEGKTFLGFQNVTTNGAGTANFTATLAASTTDSKFSATATDAVGNTSEFSGTSTGPTATATPGPTATPRPTNTPVATATPGPTSTPRPTNTPIATATPGPTSTPTPRPTATATPRPTSTPRPTATPLPTATPSPTATPAPGLSVNDVSVSEGNSGTKNATFTVTLAGTISSVVSVHYATSNGTATAGSDYTATSGTLTFGAPANLRAKGLRALTQTISVPISGDTTREGDETFFVTLSKATGATISRGQGTGTIINDDLVADLSVTQSASTPSVTTGSLATFNITVRNNGPDTAPNVVLSDGLPSNATFVSSTPNPTSQNNATLTFGLGTLASGATRTISIVVRAPSSQSTLANSATVAGTGAADPSAPNNGSSASVNVTTGAPAFTFTLGKLINVGPYSPSLYRPGAHFVQDVTITNTGTASSSAPLQLVLNGLPSTVTLVNGSGTVGGVPFIVIPNALGVGQSTKVRLEFRLVRSDRPTFTPQIIDGT